MKWFSTQDKEFKAFETYFSSIGISHTKFMICKLSMVHEMPLRKKKLRLPHKVACRLNIHDDKWIFDPK
jgi:hypothetical protein